MSNPNRAADQFLIEQGVFSQERPDRQVLLGCMACQWEHCVANDEYPEFTNVQLARCTGRWLQSFNAVATQLVDAGLLAMAERPYGRIGIAPGTSVARHYFRPLDTPAGRKFQDLLVPPDSCQQ